MIKKIEKEVCLLILIIILASTLRLVGLDRWPPALNNDEALAGYDAYSLLKTGKDNRGNPWPLYFEGFSDRVSNHFSLYVYSVIPAVAIFDLNEFSTRLPAAIYGILTVIITYFLAKEIFKNKNIGLISAFFLAISPWHVGISRFGQEAVMVPFLFSLGILLFIKGIKGKGLLLILSGIPLALSLYGYSIVKLLTPLVVLGLFFIYRREIVKYRKQAILLIIVFLLIAAPFIYLNIAHFDKLQGRLFQVSSFGHDLWFIKSIKDYFWYISPFFFWQVDYFHIFEAVLIIIGFITALTNIKNNDNKLLVYLFIIFSIPAAITISNPHFLRPVLGLAVLPILSGWAFYNILLFIKRFKLLSQRIIIIIFVLLFCVSLVNITLMVLNKLQVKPGFAYYHGFKSAVQYVKEHQAEHEKIFFTREANQPQIFLLFYLKYDPYKLQHEPVVRYYAPDNWQRVYSFDKYIFCDINQCYNKNDDNLYIARQNDIPDVKPAEIIYGPGDPVYGPNDYISFKIIDNKNNNEK